MGAKHAFLIDKNIQYWRSQNRAHYYKREVKCQKILWIVDIDEWSKQNMCMLLLCVSHFTSLLLFRALLRVEKACCDYKKRNKLITIVAIEWSNPYSSFLLYDSMEISDSWQTVTLNDNFSINLSIYTYMNDTILIIVRVNDKIKTDKLKEKNNLHSSRKL